MGAINESVYDWDLARDRFWTSATMQRLLGLPPGRLTLEVWRRSIHPDDYTRFREATVAHLKGRTERFECDYRFRSGDGTWRWARTHGLAVRDKRGRAVRMVGSTGDITELKERERELAEQKAILETTLENIDQGITMVDKNLRTIALNHRFLELLGFPPERFGRGFHMEEAFRFNAERGEYGPGDVEEQVRQRVDLSRRFEPHAFERIRPDGTVIAIRGKPLRGGGGFVSTYTDITEQKRGEERYALATAAAVEGIYEWDVETGTLFLTERAKAFFAFPDDSLTPGAWNARVHGEDYAGYRCALIHHFKGRTPQLEHEYRIADGRGGYKWVLDRGIGIRNADGRVTKLVGALSDITQRKLAEFDLRRARDEAQEALEQQKAIAEVLDVVTQLQADVQPVFEAIGRNAARLCDALFSCVYRYDGERVHLVATHNLPPAAMEVGRTLYPMRPDRSQLSGRAVLTRSIQRLEDATQDAEYATHVALAGGWRRLLAVPMLREAEPLGVIAVGWRDPGPIPEPRVELLKTFADQAVIAIEKVGLFNETKEALEQQKASGDVLQAISSSIADTAPVFDKILESCQRLFAGTIVGLNLVREDGRLHIGAYQGAHREDFEKIFPIPLTPESGSGLAILERRAVHYPDAERAEVPERTRRGCKAIGVKSVIFAPVLWEERGLGAIFVGRDNASSFSEKDIALLRTFADQAAIAIENARLFREIREKGAQLEVASRHKSEFLANMSHELRTPLNAIIGFTRIVMRQSKEVLAHKQYENLEKILASGHNLLALINAVLDLSKVEAGRVEVQPREVELAPVLEQCLRTVEPLVRVALVKELDGALPQMYVDEEKLRQIVMNLLSNAAKFTERGVIWLRAQAANGSIAITVADTGIGIAADKLGLIFEEFEQADAGSTRTYGGTGLGLTIARRLARLMGGDIGVESTLGSGSRFTLTLPLRYPS